MNDTPTDAGSYVRHKNGDIELREPTTADTPGGGARDASGKLYGAPPEPKRPEPGGNVTQLGDGKTKR